MDATGVLEDAFGRVRGAVHAAVEGLAQEQLAARPDPGANSIAWLVWHLTRVQDDHVADAFGLEQVWLADGWASRFGLALPLEDTGYGHGSGEVDALGVVPASLLLGYHDAVHDRTVEALRGASAADLDRVVDTSWDPPVTLGVRLVSVVDDDLEHAGQAGYVRGLVLRGAVGAGR